MNPVAGCAIAQQRQWLDKIAALMRAEMKDCQELAADLFTGAFYQEDVKSWYLTVSFSTQDNLDEWNALGLGPWMLSFLNANVSNFADRFAGLVSIVRDQGKMEASQQAVAQAIAAQKNRQAARHQKNDTENRQRRAQYALAEAMLADIRGELTKRGARGTQRRRAP